MATKTDQADGAEAAAPARYEVKLSARFEHLGFAYLPGHQHEVDKTIFDEMKAAGVVADGKQLS